MDLNIINKKLKKERRIKNLTLAQLSILSGIPKTTLQGYENGRIKNLSHERLIQLAKFYGKDPNYFLLDETPESKDMEFNLTLRIFLAIISNIISQFELLDEKNKNKLLEYISKFIKKNNQ